MASITATDEKTGRKFYLDDPDDLKPGEKVTVLLSLHGGGSVGAWQRAYFPAVDYKDKYRLVIARMWVGDADDPHLHNIVDMIVARYGKNNIERFWLVGHSQGGMTSRRLLGTDKFFQDRVDGWLSLSGGRLGVAERAKDFALPMPPGVERRMPNFAPPPPVDTDLSHIFTTGEYEIESLPATSPVAEKYGAAPRERRADIVDTEGGKIHDTGRESYSNKGWGFKPGPGTAEVYVYPKAKDGRVIADVVRMNKGHTEGLEPKVTEELIKLIVSSPGGKIRSAT
jgi:pimeloyl-ACP methyl ester carboxylesterase